MTNFILLISFYFIKLAQLVQLRWIPNSSKWPNMATKGPNGKLVTLFGLMPFSLIGSPSVLTTTLVEPIIIYLILIPLLGVLVILFTNFDKIKELPSITPLIIKQNSDTVLYNIALFFSLLNLLVSVIMWYFFNNGCTSYGGAEHIELGTQFQFIFEINQFSFGVDGISIFFVLLTTFITPIAIFSSYELYVSSKANNSSDTINLKIFLISLLLLETLQICAFVSLDLLLFYIFFESVLPVLFILIVVFGHGENRFRSAFLLFLYTLAGSLPMLLSILTIYSYLDSTDYQLISFNEISLESQKWLWLGFFIALAVKTPLVPFSIWLPKAHGDSPLAGSIILAATILKLATYFYLRVLINYLPDASNYFSPLVQTIAVISIIYASFATIVQEDTKRLIAYSSVAHMGVVVLGLFSNTLHGIEGAILLSLAHGWVSPALFICVGGIVYERTGTRIIYYIRGLANMMPIFTIMFFVFTLANTGIPLSLNFLGEQLALMGIWEVNPVVAALGASGILLSACYSLFLMNRLSYGDYSPYLYPVKDLNRREYHLLLGLIIPTFFFGIFPNVILEGLHMVGTSLLYN
jgi:proton-translocating NADH-quinone oxidoreductase chain M